MASSQTPDIFRRLREALVALSDNPGLENGIAIANAVLDIVQTGLDPVMASVIDECVLSLPNAERQDSWFQKHPWMGGQRSAFELLDSSVFPLQAKFYWLKKKSRQIIAGGVHLTENWEDFDYTRNSGFKVGIDFFLSPDADAVQVVLSNRGNLRLLELSGRLTNTQQEVFNGWKDIASLPSAAALHSTLWGSFKLQSVNEDFYTGVSNSFMELEQHLTSEGSEVQTAKLFASRLLGRIIFAWFLRKKKLIDETHGYFAADERAATAYYRDRLARLFFLTLNTPIEDREPGSMQQSGMLMSVDFRTPYLNGGLFAPQDSDRVGDLNLTFPEGYFIRLYEHLDDFNFTTDESTPEYEQVAIDPEMLGRVFESLLATQIAESGEQARKAKGAFYTPREIVAHMARESLRSYLRSVVPPDDHRFTASIDELLDKSDQQWAIGGSNSLRDAVPVEYRRIIIAALDDLKAIDPACGSGAFPIGMMQLLAKTYERLDPRLDSYRTKLNIVQNNIFGVDIEPMAVEISRLRAWLSLVVEVEPGREVEPLPNLDFKFVCANSLLPLQGDESLFSETELLRQLASLRRDYFIATHSSEKSQLQAEYRELTESPTSLFEDPRTVQVRSFNPFDDSSPASYFDAENMFGVQDGFDIVIGNPPYIGEKGHKDIFAPIKASALGRQFYVGKMDYFYFFFHLGLDVLKEGGVLCYITTNYYVTATYAKKLIEDLKRRAILLELVNFNEIRVFDSAAGQHNMVTLLEKGHDSSRQAQTTVVDKIPSGLNSGTLISDVLARSSAQASYYALSQEELFDGATIRLTNSSSNPIETILSKMAQTPVRLKDVCNVSQGVLTSADRVSKAHLRKFPQANLRVGDGIFVLTALEVEALRLSPFEMDLIKPWFKNSDIHKYVTTDVPSHFVVYADKKFANLVTRPALSAHLDRYRVILDASSSNSPYLHRPRTIPFDEPKIVAPQRSRTNAFGYNDVPWFGSADVYYITDRTGAIPLKALVGILNSKLYFCWLYFRGKRKGEMLELYGEPLENLPLPAISSNAVILGKIAEEVDIIRSHSGKGDVAKASIQRVDELVFSLYDLDELEVLAIENWRTRELDGVKKV